MQRDCDVCRQCPRSRRPDNKLLVSVQNAFSVLDIEADIDGRILAVEIDDFGIRNSRFLIRRPVDRLKTLEDHSIQRHLGETAYLSSFKLFIQGDVRMLIVTDLPQTLFCSHLLSDLFAGVFFALLSEFLRRNLFMIDTELLDRILDRQSMRIPSREKRRVVSQHRLRSDNDILDDAVHSRAGMQIAVGIRRTVMQNKRHFPFILL